LECALIITCVVAAVLHGQQAHIPKHGSKAKAGGVAGGLASKLGKHCRRLLLVLIHTALIQKASRLAPPSLSLSLSRGGPARRRRRRRRRKAGLYVQANAGYGYTACDMTVLVWSRNEPYLGGL
jgi:hypothetical protein